MSGYREYKFSEGYSKHVWLKNKLIHSFIIKYEYDNCFTVRSNLLNHKLTIICITVCVYSERKQMQQSMCTSV